MDFKKVRFDQYGPRCVACWQRPRMSGDTSLAAAIEWAEAHVCPPPKNDL